MPHPSEFENTYKNTEGLTGVFSRMKDVINNRCWIDEYKGGISASEVITITGAAVVSLVAHTGFDSTFAVTSWTLQNIPLSLGDIKDLKDGIYENLPNESDLRYTPR